MGDVGLISRMKTAHPLLLITCGILTLSPPARALEIRTWTSLTGKSIEAEYVRADGEKIVLKDKDGREMVVKRAELSQGDLRYIAEVAPKSSTPLLGEKPVKPGATPNPAKEAKIDQKTFKPRTDRFKLPESTYNILETPHFLIMYPDKIEAADLGETAERVWLDMTFFHPGFSQKFKDRKMAVFLVEQEYDYEKIGKWYADMIRKSEQPNADRIADGLMATWKQAAAANLQMTQEVADEYGVLRYARVFRTSTGSGSAKREKVKGVFVPFRVHCLAQDMMNIHTGGVSGFGSKGLFAIQTGHAYFKEILITGRSETSMLREAGTGHEVSSTGGFDSTKNWADELKKLLRRDKDLKPSIEALYNTNLASAKPEMNVLAYSFSRYLQSNTDRMAKYAELLEKIDTGSQIPEPVDLAKIYGFADVASMQADWIAYLNSSSFK